MGIVSKKELQRRIENLERRIRFMTNAICSEGHAWHIDYENGYRTCKRCGLVIIDDDEPDVM